MQVDRPDLVPQPHGGALYRGGVRGNRGNRIRQHVRRQALNLVAQRLPVLASIADGVIVEFGETPTGERALSLGSPSPAERTNAMRLLWEVGSSGEKQVALPEVRKRLRQQVEVIRATLAPAQADALLHALQGIWK